MHAVMHLIAKLVYYVTILSFDVCNYQMGPHMNTQRHDTFDSFFCHVIVYVVFLYFKINIIIPNLFSCQKTRPSFKTETLGIKTKTKTFKVRSRDQDPSLENSMSGTVVHETETQVSRTPCLAQSSTRPRPKSRELHDPSLENSMSGTVVHEFTCN